LVFPGGAVDYVLSPELGKNTKTGESDGWTGSTIQAAKRDDGWADRRGFTLQMGQTTLRPTARASSWDPLAFWFRSALRLCASIFCLPRVIPPPPLPSQSPVVSFSLSGDRIPIGARPGPSRESLDSSSLYLPEPAGGRTAGMPRRLRAVAGYWAPFSLQATHPGRSAQDGVRFLGPRSFVSVPAPSRATTGVIGFLAPVAWLVPSEAGSRRPGFSGAELFVWFPFLPSQAS
jgi:hypothetical protein